MLEVLYHRAKYGGARLSPAAEAAKNVEFFVCLSVCLFVRHAFERQSVRVYAPCFAMKALEYRNNFDAVGSGKVCSRAPVFNFLTLMSTGDTTKCQVQKTVKIGGLPAEADRINRYRDEISHVSVHRGSALAH